MRTSCTMETTSPSIIINMIVIIINPQVGILSVDNLLYDGDNKKTDSMEAFPSAEHYQVKNCEKLYGSDRLDKDDKIVMISITYSLEFSG